MNSKKKKFCCERFRESVKEKKFVKSYMMDETDWFIPEGLHVYFCPFCGKNIKGKGYGTFDVDSNSST